MGVFVFPPALAARRGAERRRVRSITQGTTLVGTGQRPLHDMRDKTAWRGWIRELRGGRELAQPVQKESFKKRRRRRPQTKRRNDDAAQEEVRDQGRHLRLRAGP